MRSSPISPGVADSVISASSGIASSPISAPNHDALEPAQSRRKFRSAHALAVVMTRKAFP